MFNWILKPFLCLALGMSQVAVEFDKNTEGAVNFGYDATFDGANMDDLTMSAWVYPSTYDSPYSPLPPRIIDYYSEGSIFNFYIGWTGSNRNVGFNVRWAGTAGTFVKYSVVPQNQWSHIVATYENGVAGKIYVNGVLQTNSVNIISTGNVDNGPNSPGILFVGNQYDSVNKYKGTFQGKMKDVRIYKRVLSAAEVTTLYNGGTPDMDLVTDGLQFQAFVVPTFRLTDFVDTTLTSDMKVRDRIYGVVGTPHGSPIGRNP